MMTEHKATPEQWADVEDWAANNGTSHACLLELRARVEVLEATSKPSPNSSQIGSSLVARVAIAISQCEDSSCWDDESVNWTPEARAAIREMAAWMTSNPDIYFPPALVFAIEQEIER
jgi:hypothetical protein